MSKRLRILIAVAGVVLVAGGAVWWFVVRHDPGDARLNQLVHAKPPVPVVFTSRSEPASFEAAAPEGEVFTHLGQRLWTAREGRLRLLTPRGTVHELTWGRTLPDGGTLIDVMSPSVSLDGKTIYFAGRKDGDDHGHFRLYEVKIDGSELKPLTGGADDGGAVAAPPLRFRADGTMMDESERRRIDYDDVDPVELRSEPREVVFVSSRTPDLGRDHARRSTTLWVLRADGRKSPASANRNNDRWPWLMSSGYVAFSLWSRNREVVSEDATDLKPFDPAVPCSSSPTDHWLGAFLRIGNDGHFGMLVKPAVPVWRPRSLFNGRMTFATTYGDPSDLKAPLTVVQAEPGLLASAPSSAIGSLPKQRGVRLRRGPEVTTDGRPLWLATPSPCPDDRILMAGAPLDAIHSTSPEPGRWGLYIASEDWPDQEAAPTPESVQLRLLFDDPQLVDAEPVAVYRRSVNLPPGGTEPRAQPDLDLKLAGGRMYRGKTGTVMMTGLSLSAMNDLPGQQTDSGEGPIFASPPRDAIQTIKVFAARRDRFDDPNRTRIPGRWELLMEMAATDTAGGPLPVDSPTVLAGFGKDGKVVQWTTAAKDSTGHQASFYALAGDHYSLTTAGGKHFCVGCHPGHSGIPHREHNHAERLGD